MYKTLENYNNTRENYIEHATDDMPSNQPMTNPGNGMPASQHMSNDHNEMLTIINTLTKEDLKNIMMDTINPDRMKTLGVDDRNQFKFKKTLQGLFTKLEFGINDTRTDMPTDMSPSDDGEMAKPPSADVFEEILHIISKTTEKDLDVPENLNMFNNVIPTLTVKQLEIIKNEIGADNLKMIMSKVDDNARTQIESKGFNLKKLMNSR